jgi:hypothetical protein
MGAIPVRVIDAEAPRAVTAGNWRPRVTPRPAG